MISRNNVGQVIRVHTYTGQMRKHGSDRPAFTDPVRIELDAVAHSGVKTPRRGLGYIRRTPKVQGAEVD